MEKYTIDLDTILQVLQGFHQNGILSADLPARRLDNKALWKAQLRLIEGEVVACSILDEKGALTRSGGSALKSLRKAGQLNWVMVQASKKISPSSGIRLDQVTDALPSDSSLPALQQTRPLLPTAPYWKTFSQSLVPRRLVAVTGEQMSQGRWPRNHRMVYAMIDGTRTVEKIMSLLSLHPEETGQIMQDLQVMKVVILDD